MNELEQKKKEALEAIAELEITVRSAMDRISDDDPECLDKRGGIMKVAGIVNGDNPFNLTVYMRGDQDEETTLRKIAKFFPNINNKNK